MGSSMLKDGVAQSTQCDVVENWTLNKSVLLLRWCSLVHIIFLGLVVWTCDIRINPKILLRIRGEWGAACGRGLDCL